MKSRIGFSLCLLCLAAVCLAVPVEKLTLESVNAAAGSDLDAGHVRKARHFGGLFGYGGYGGYPAYYGGYYPGGGFGYPGGGFGYPGYGGGFGGGSAVATASASSFGGGFGYGR